MNDYLPVSGTNNPVQQHVLEPNRTDGACPDGTGDEPLWMTEWLERCGRYAENVRALIDTAYPSDETTTDDPVKADIDRTIDHLQNHRVSPDQRRDLKKATEQAERTNSNSDAAVGRALR